MLIIRTMIILIYITFFVSISSFLISRQVVENAAIPISAQLLAKQVSGDNLFEQ